MAKFQFVIPRDGMDPLTGEATSIEVSGTVEIDDSGRPDERVTCESEAVADEVDSVPAYGFRVCPDCGGIRNVDRADFHKLDAIEFLGRAIKVLTCPTCKGRGGTVTPRTFRLTDAECRKIEDQYIEQEAACAARGE